MTGLNIDFGNPNALFPLLTVLLLMLAWGAWTLWKDRRDLDYLGEQNLVWSPLRVWARRAVKGTLALVALVFLFLGAAQLQGKPVPEELNMSGVDVMIVLDVSKSMLSQDILPNRLTAAKRALFNWISNRQGDRVGLVIFAGESLVQVPLTMDLNAVQLVLVKADPDEVDRGGTDIGEGIQTALDSLDKEEDKKRGKAILLMTDGEITEGSAILPKVLERAAQMKVPIVTVGMGTPQGRPIPDGTAFWGEMTYKRDAGGSVHISRLDETTLRHIADSTGGEYIPGDTEQNLKSINSTLDKLQKTLMKGEGGMKREELSPRMALGAAFSLFLASVL